MSYSHISAHRAMVFDTTRNQAYLRALEKVITPATTVMDLGAGLAVHGLNAARQGAARVLLVEPAPGGTMILDRARMEVVPVMAADYYQKHIESWSGDGGHAVVPDDSSLSYSAVCPYALTPNGRVATTVASITSMTTTHRATSQQRCSA